MSQAQVQSVEEMQRIVNDWVKNYRPKWFAGTIENRRKLADYIFTEQGGGVVTVSSLTKAAEALKDELEHLPPSPQEAEAHRQENLRQAIYADVSQKISGKLNFQDPATINPLAAWLHKNKAGRMSADTLMEAIHALRFELPWVQEPRGLAKNRRNESLGYTDSREEHGIQGRRNHAEDTIDRESTERTKKYQEKLKGDEARVIGKMLFEDSIDSYVAVRNGRVSQAQTEAVRAALRKYAAKHGSAVLSLIREMPDNDSTEFYIRKRI